MYAKHVNLQVNKKSICNSWIESVTVLSTIMQAILSLSVYLIDLILTERWPQVAANRPLPPKLSKTSAATRTMRRSVTWPTSRHWSSPSIQASFASVSSRTNGSSSCITRLVSLVRRHVFDFYQPLTRWHLFFAAQNIFFSTHIFK